MGKYALLFKQLLKGSGDKDPNYVDLEAAEQMVRLQLRHGDDLLPRESLVCGLRRQLQGAGTSVVTEQVLVPAWAKEGPATRLPLRGSHSLLQSETRPGTKGLPLFSSLQVNFPSP